MNARNDLDLFLRAHLETTADPTVVDGQVDSILAITAGRRQEPAWLASLRSLPMSTTARSLGRPLSAPAWAMLIVLALLIAIVAVGLTVGGWRLAPAPIVNGPIVFGRLGPPEGEMVVHITRPDGSDTRVVLPGANECPQFSPDGRRLSLGYGTVAIDGTDLRVFTGQPDGINLGCSTWSPDGSRLATEGWNDSNRDVNGIFLVDADDGTGATRLTTNGQGGNDMPGDFSPDGRHLAFVRGQAGEDIGTIWVVDLETGTARQVIDDRVAYGVSWSPDGQWLVAGRALVPFTETRFIVLRPDGSALRNIGLLPEHNWANAPSFSPDGTRLVFDMAVGTSENADVYTMRLDGTDLVQVTDTPSDNEHFTDWGIDPVR
jgi:hypothetical protein